MRWLLAIAVVACLFSGAPASAKPDLVGLADADGDGVISRDEFTAYYALIWLFSGAKAEIDIKQAPPPLRAMILSVMPGVQGIVTRDRMLDAAPAHYSDADENKDGIVTLEEFRAWKPVATTALPR